MNVHTNIFLIGPMGSGKSAVGRQLARELGMDFHDSDEIIEERTGVDISYIFEKEGESGFRKREAAILAEMVREEGVVLATGGGTVENTETRYLLQKHGTVVYLYTSVPEQQRRTRKSRNRPLLNDGNPGKVLEKLMATRDPQYREIADITIETDGRQVTAVTRELKNALNSDADQN
ncbi:MAG: shikimate kinase AroK [Gammaproteobacteria bacterium]|nr:shikimate kinase AroK [Gammaproteobacteria bacterium]MCP4089950.1 shikimate kinase AroK [Gammaproteobacteria bacterium]MCP4276281.1 shikimate kinase AroK [Gammaproteobacteria bacterium]MCP4831276.1 shikimate kinase AroK [Gammaproteobacteria bacterium]MCP4928759.1 shikimate kinase AroK [Gammaproteobacteria bacterium]